MLWIRLCLILAAVAFIEFAPNVRAADAPICSSVLYDDKVLLAALPTRLRPIVDSARVRSLVIKREAAWADFHQVLDWGLTHEGQKFTGQLSGISTDMIFKRSRLGDLQLWIEDSAKKSLSHEKVPTRSFQVLDFIIAELAWVAKARAIGKITGLTIIAEDLQTTRIADFMISLGFKKGRRVGPECLITGLVGGILGFEGGRLFFMKEDSGVENGSIYDDRRKFYRDLTLGAAGGGSLATALFCARKTQHHYSLEFKPDGVSVPPADPFPLIPLIN